MSHSTNAVAALAALKAARDGSRLTGDQVAALRSFPGWGPLASLFDAGLTGRQATDAADLANAVTGLDTSAISKTLDTCFYTPAHLIDGMWALLSAAGFTGGRVVDLGCGTGRFLTHKPAGLPVQYTGVELEPVTAEIAQHLHPDARILVGDVATVMPGSGFDAAIGNAPFASTSIRMDEGTVPLHTYCAIKAARLVRPGGYVAIVTSRYLMDSANQVGRNLLAASTNLVAAIRLPSGYFAGEGTNVVADLLIMQVRSSLDDRSMPGTGWTNRAGVAVDDLQVSAYWSSHPQFVAGTMEETGFSQSPLRVRATDPIAAVDAALAAAASNLTPMMLAPASEAFPGVRLADDLGRPEGSFHETDDGGVIRIVDGRVTPVARPARELRALIGLRNDVDALLAGDADWDRPDAELIPVREKAARTYREYVAAFGPLNRGKMEDGPIDEETGVPSMRWRAPTMGGFRGDPGFWRVLAIECYDRNTSTATEAEVLARRINRRPEPATSAADPAEALAISLGEGGLDLSRIASLLRLPSPDAAVAALGDLIFHDPNLNQYVAARDYLSGQVRRKLAAARLAAAADARYLSNVAALEAVQPAWLYPADIRIELGSPLLTAADVEQFAADVLGASGDVTYTPVAGHWEVNLYRVSVFAAASFGTGRRSADVLLQDGLNSRVPAIYDNVYDPLAGRSRRVRNAEETEAAVTKLGELADRFSTWVWECPKRAQRVEHDYNHRFNATVVRQPDGSQLQMPRLADGVELWPWQKDWVDHALNCGDGAWAGHDVGLGKTLSQITFAVTLRDFGLAQKPLIAVPDHLIEQIAAEAVRAFPSCKFLIVTRKDLTRDRRRLFAARCATGDWDAVIITHTGFSAIPMPAEFERGQLQRELDVLSEHMRQAGVRSKRIAGLMRTAEQRLMRLRGHADPDMVTFTQLGVDHISIDEAHRFRRLAIQTVSDEFSLGSSVRAFDLYLKVQWLRERNEGRPCIAGYSATPWINTLAETYVLQKIYAPQQLADADVEAFDAWAAQFVRFETLIEVSPDGSGFRTKRRPSVIQNLPEMRSMLRQFMMLLRAEDVGIERPDARFHTITADPSPVAEEFMRQIVERADNLRSGRVRDLSVDNMLKICNDGRAVALDTHLVGRSEIKGMATKLVLCADNAARIYRENAHKLFPGSTTPGVFQFIMCDVGTPHPGDSRTYGRLRDLLIARGVPANKIRFIHDAKGPKAREALFATCRSGETAIAVGSTDLIGVGVNAQFRAAALHDLDVPWTPAALEQRHGRIIRYGNQHDTVDLYSYVTEGTFDAFMSGTVERKATGFAHLYAINSPVREISDVSETLLNIAEVKAAATGNPILLRQHQLRGQVRALQVARSTSMQNAVAARQDADHKRSVATGLERVALPIARLLGATFASLDVEQAANAIENAVDDRVTLGRIAGNSFHNPTVTVALNRQLGATRLQFICQHRTIGGRDMPGDVRRRTPEGIAQWCARVTNNWLTALDEHHAELAERMAALRADADALDAAANAVGFDRQPELDQLLAELDAVNAEVAEVAGQSAANRDAA